MSEYPNLRRFLSGNVMDRISIYATQNGQVGAVATLRGVRVALAFGLSIEGALQGLDGQVAALAIVEENDGND